MKTIHNCTERDNEAIHFYYIIIPLLETMMLFVDYFTPETVTLITICPNNCPVQDNRSF